MTAVAEVTELIPPRTLVLPGLSRAAREAELHKLLDAVTVGVPPSEAQVRAAVCYFSSPLLSTGEALALWADVVAECERWTAVEAGEPKWRDLQPGLAEEDFRAAMGDLLDGTGRYHGDRA